MCIYLYIYIHEYSYCLSSLTCPPSHILPIAYRYHFMCATGSKNFVAYTAGVFVPMVDVSVRNTAGDTLAFVVAVQGTIADIKEVVAIKWSIPPACQTLILATTLLGDIERIDSTHTRTGG